MRARRFVHLHRLSFAAAALSAGSLLPLIWADRLTEAGRQRLLPACGAGFWLFFALELLTLLPQARLRPGLETVLEKVRIPWRGSVGLGALSFLKNRDALVCDGLALLLTAAVLTLYLCRVQAAWAVIPTTAACLLAWNLHALTNGRHHHLYMKIQKQKLHKGE